MSGLKILSYFFMVLAAGSATAILFSRDVFKGALCLLVALLSIAALYALSFAEFVAVTQILVYAGGILVVILFGIMLTTKIAGRALVVGHKNILSGGLAAISLFILLVRCLPVSANANNLIPESISDIGLTILIAYSLPFEIAGLLLLMALIGAAVTTAHLKSKV